MPEVRTILPPEDSVQWSLVTCCDELHTKMGTKESSPQTTMRDYRHKENGPQACTGTEGSGRVGKDLLLDSSRCGEGSRSGEGNDRE